MAKESRRNLAVERAVALALQAVDAELTESSQSLPTPPLRRAVDDQIDQGKGSAILAAIFFLAYSIEEPGWDHDHLPSGLRGRYGDKAIATGMSERSLTLHDNITAFGENSGWKGNVQGIRLSETRNLKDFLLAVKGAGRGERETALRYFAGRFAASRRLREPLPPLSPDVLTFARARVLLNDLVGIPSQGHIQQFVVAGLLRAHRRRVGTVIRTHHPHAADSFDQAAGDIEEYREGLLVAAYEVTDRDDWKNRLQDFRRKMADHGLSKYWIIASEVYTDADLADPAHMLRFLEPVHADVAVVELRSFIDVFAAELTSSELRDAINEVYEDLVDPKLSGRQVFIDAYKERVGSWLDSISL